MQSHANWIQKGSPIPARRGKTKNECHQINFPDFSIYPDESIERNLQFVRVFPDIV